QRFREANFAESVPLRSGRCAITEGFPMLLGPKTRALSPLAALLLATAPLALGCAAEEKTPQSALEYAENARAKYEQGVRALEAENWEAATETFNELKKKYGYSRYARLAELRLADANL